MNSTYDNANLLITSIHKLICMLDDESVFYYLDSAKNNSVSKLEKEKLLAEISHCLDELSASNIPSLDAPLIRELKKSIKKLEFKLKINKKLSLVSNKLIESVLQINGGLNNLCRYDKKGKSKIAKVRTGTMRGFV